MELMQFIIKFFVSKRLSLLTVFVCWKPDETIKLWRSANSNGLKLRVYDMGASAGDVTSLPQLPAYDVHREGVFVDVTCPNTDLVLSQASSQRAFIPRYAWLMLQRAPSDPYTAQSMLRRVAVLPDCDVTWWSHDARAPRTPSLHDVYTVKQNLPIITTRLPLNYNYSIQAMEAFWNGWPTPVTRRKNLGNLLINTGTIITQPQHFKGWSDLTNRQIDTYPKVTYPLLMLLAEDLNFSLKLHDAKFGFQAGLSTEMAVLSLKHTVQYYTNMSTPVYVCFLDFSKAFDLAAFDRHNMLQVDLYGEEYNGSFTGLAGLLQRDRIEIGVASMFMRNDRWKVLHFVSETFGLTGAFIFRQPSASSVSNVFALPLSGGVWAAAGGVLAAAAALLAAQAAALRLRTLRPADAATFALAAICQQGFHMSPAPLSVRMAMFSTLVCSVFTFTAYCAKVVALLQAPSDAIQTIDQLAHSPLSLGVQDTTYKRVYFAESREPATQRLYRRKLLPLGDAAYLSVVDGVARLRTGLFAFQVEQSSGYDIISKTFTEEEKCCLKEIQAFKLPMVAVPMRRHSGYRELVAVRLRWQRETGAASRERRRWLAERARCRGPAAAFRSVALADIMPAVQIVGAGMSISVVLLLLEFFVSHINFDNIKAIGKCPTFK